MKEAFRSLRPVVWVGLAAAAMLVTQLQTAEAEPVVALDHRMGASIRAHEEIEPDLAFDGVEYVPGVAAGATRTPGFDVSHWEGAIDWATVKAKGAKFAYIKATEGTNYRDPSFGANYLGAYEEGIIRGAFHYARPDVSGGAVQADYFVTHGGTWSPDGLTLPGALDIEWGTEGQGGDCYGLSQAAMAVWVGAFSDEYHARTTRWPVIYTSTKWWTECVGTKGAFAGTDPLWVARRSSTVGPLPYDWTSQTIWQYAYSGTFPGDQDWFNGSYGQLQALARG